MHKPYEHSVQNEAISGFMIYLNIRAVDAHVGNTEAGLLDIGSFWVHVRLEHTGVSWNVVKIDERSIFCPKDRQFFAPQAKTSTMDRVFLAF